MLYRFHKNQLVSQDSNEHFKVFCVAGIFISSAGCATHSPVQRILIGLYDSWKNGDDSRLPQGWWEEESFLADYAQAAQNAGEERLIEAWLAEEPA
ncbi:hypothetical protein [Pseudomonas chlororaphis]|uniref:hypothetical protein n=1 Tax=Pseudomonas chlororaphis TaxID=587753 RepID=UPI000F55B886|nr:hypothetical protein [Pseudomonas chlororaphis]